MNKHIGDFFHHCEPEDNNCWKNQFAHIIQCENDNVECWRKRLPQLPCSIQDIQCWKHQIPDLPCQYNDYQCFKNRLPDLPCKILDMVCWQRHIKNWTPQGLRKTDQGIQPLAEHRPVNWMYGVDADSRHSQ